LSGQLLEALRKRRSDWTKISELLDPRVIVVIECRYQKAESFDGLLLGPATSKVIHELALSDPEDPSRALRMARPSIATSLRESTRERFRHQVHGNLGINAALGQVNEDALGVLPVEAREVSYGAL
jgi:hypothetical protein